MDINNRVDFNIEISGFDSFIHSSPILKTFKPIGNQIFTASKDQTIKYWDFEDGVHYLLMINL